jgi:uncharacterized YigZ family protein
LNSYRTLLQPSQSDTLTIKKSKFIGLALPVTSENDIKIALEKVKSDFAGASHWCYAYKIGFENEQVRYSDDGEPNNSAGKPIFGQILNYDLQNVLVVVVRYYGGTKLGVGGLMSAYKEAAFEALQNAEIVIKEITSVLVVNFKYELLNEVMRIAKQYNLEFLEQQLELECLMKFEVAKRHLSSVVEQFQRHYEISFKILKD